MRFFGDNSRFGAGHVDLTSKRAVEGTVREGEEFPCGIAGLMPVVFKRKKGGTKTVYAFSTVEGESNEREAVEDAVDLTNRLLAQAAELSQSELGQIGEVSMGITEDGLGFTRVELVPIDAHNQPSDSPVHLHIETSVNPGEAGSISTVIELDSEGAPVRAVITQYKGDDLLIRVNVNVNDKNGMLSVSKVEEVREGKGRLTYKRGWTPKSAAYVAARKEGRETRGGKFARETGRRPAPAAPVEEEFSGSGRVEGGRHRRRFDDERETRGGAKHAGRPAHRDEIPGMRRIDGSAAKRSGTRSVSDDRFDDRGERRGRAERDDRREYGDRGNRRGSR